MIQVLFAAPFNGISGGAQYAVVQGATGWNGTETSVRTPWPAPGVFRNLVVEVSAAPAGTASRIFTLRKNGAGTALTATVSASATTARLTGVDVTVAAGDLVTLQHTLTGTPVAATARWSLEFEGSVAKQSGYTDNLGSGNVPSGGGLKHCGVFAVGTQTSAVPASVSQTVAAPGTLTRTDLCTGGAPGVGNGVTAYVNLNGVRQDGSGGTVNTACALIGAGIQASATYSLPLAAGDLVRMDVVPSGTYGAFQQWGLGTAFTATTDGQSQLCGSTITQTLSNTATSYGPAAAIGVGLGPTETTFINRLLPGITPVTLSGLRVVSSVAPGAGKSRLVDLRVSAVSSSVTATISDTATTASDLTHTATIVDGADRWNLRTVPTGTPATATLFWSFIQGSGTAAPAVTRVQPFVWMPV